MTYFPPQSKTVIFNTTGTGAGSFTWVAPSGVSHINLILIGGGGGGASGASGGNADYPSLHAGGGGASGGCGSSGIINIFNQVAVSSGTVYSLYVGAGGAGGANAAPVNNGNNGTAGENTSFLFPNGISLRAQGGIAGKGGSHGGSASSGANGIAGAVAFASPSGGADGSQAGQAGGSATPNTAVIPTDSTTQNSFIYQLNTSVAVSPFFTGQTINYLPFGASPANISGATALDTTSSLPAGSTSGAPVTGNPGGGAGGVINLSKLIPIYLIGSNFNSLSSIVLPDIYSSGSGTVGLGNGGVYNSHRDGTTPTDVKYWSNSTATVIGYGAGGLGGPGGGGASNDIVGAGTPGTGLKGDTGLNGVIIISY